MKICSVCETSIFHFEGFRRQQQKLFYKTQSHIQVKTRSWWNNQMLILLFHLVHFSCVDEANDSAVLLQTTHSSFRKSRLHLHRKRMKMKMFIIMSSWNHKSPKPLCKIMKMFSMLCISPHTLDTWQNRHTEWTADRKCSRCGHTTAHEEDFRRRHPLKKKTHNTDNHLIDVQVTCMIRAHVTYNNI